MTLQTIPRIAVDGTLRVVKAPADLAARAIPGERGDSARDAVATADATARAVFGALLRDEELTADAERRVRAVQERARARKLHETARERAQRADQVADELEDEAEAVRRRADKQAAERRNEAQRKRKTEKDEAARRERERKEAERREAERVRAEDEERAKRERLEALDEKAEALAAKEAALRAADESHRMRVAAAEAKAQRKSD